MILRMIYTSVIAVLFLVQIVHSLDVQFASLPETITPGAAVVINWKDSGTPEWELEFLQNNPSNSAANPVALLKNPSGAITLTVPTNASPGTLQLVAVALGSALTTVTASPDPLVVQSASSTPAPPNTEALFSSTFTPDGNDSSISNTSPVPSVTSTSVDGADFAGKRTRLSVVLPSVIGAVLVSPVLCFVLWRYVRKRRSKEDSGIPIAIIDNTGSRSSFTQPRPYDLKPEFSSNNLLPVIRQPFPGERESMRPFHLPANISLMDRTAGLFTRLPWNQPPSSLERPHPYELKPEDFGPIPSRQRQSVLSFVETNVQASSSTLTHFRSRSESSILIRSPTAQSNSTSRQLRLQEEADQMRARLSALARDAARSEVQEDMHRMRDHIERLETLVMSNWARGLTDEPPPMYRA
ncbi:hypothetical protein D9758_004962 [Tetrapyrgos nigripes]|uniref:Uncharacterized protein n=1 Tax=Tetrapyrgos nigripes TaxID=182062 RepID=A0A8H5GW62_9AGAR|nr:hypothetical protein D9758_004962 [Tetrapyrgos nigripes]